MIQTVITILIVTGAAAWALVRLYRFFQSARREPDACSTDKCEKCPYQGSDTCNPELLDRCDERAMHEPRADKSKTGCCS